MCFFLYVASPLTLSEVRAMLPAGFTADPLSRSEERRFQRFDPDVRVVVRLLLGACSCDVVLPRTGDARQDELPLRDRFRRLRLPRERVLERLDQHRRALELRPATLAERQAALAGFVAEHARNAGPSLYYLHFSPDGLRDEEPAGPPALVTVEEVRHHPGTWLAEDRLVRVVR